MDADSAAELLTFAEEAERRVRGLDAKAVLADLERRSPELLAALQWFIDAQRAEEALRLVSALSLYWTGTKRLEEGLLWAGRAAVLPSPASVVRGRALFDIGLMTFWTGDDAGAAALHREALAMGRQIGDPTVIALALGGLARIALRTDIEEARRLSREALAVTEGTRDTLGRSGALHLLGVCAQMAGNFAEARDFMMARIEIGRATGNYAAIAAEAGNLSMVERQLGNLDAAETLAREALSLAYRRGDEWMLPYPLNGLAAIAVERHEFERAAVLIGSAEAQMEAQGTAWPPDERPHYERTVAGLSEALGDIGGDRLRARGREMPLTDVVAFALGERAGA